MKVNIKDIETGVTWLRHVQDECDNSEEIRNCIEFLNAEVLRKINLKSTPNNGCTCDQLEEPDKEEGWTCYWCYENDIE